MSEKKVPVSVLVPEQIHGKLEVWAKETHRTKSAYIRQVLRRYARYMETRSDPDAPPVNWEIR